MYELDQDVTLAVKDLSISFGGLKAVSEFSFEVKNNEIFGLIGPNGAGKTTLFNCITQFYRPDKGQVIFRTKQDTVVDLVGQKVHDTIGMGLVRTFQNVEVVKEISVIDNILIGAHIDFKASLVSQILRLPKATQEEKRLREKAENYLDFLGILHLKDQLAGGQPYGILKKMELVRTLMCDPSLIILDEPAAGLNDDETIALAETIKHIRNHFHCAILLVEHDMGLVMNVCDRVCAISFGKFLACDVPERIQSNPTVQAAYLGEDEDEQ